MHKWYVVQVIPGRENRVKKGLEDHLHQSGMAPFISEILLPTENVAEMKQGEQKITEKKLWPGYILIKMEFNDESWGYVKDVTGVIDFLGGEAPPPLTEREITEILSEVKDKKKEVVHKHKFQTGDRVKIVDGVFVNFIGTVMEVFHDKGRLSVLVSIFGRDTRVDDLEFWQVEEVTDS